jgi:hypothetical protein
MSSSVRDRLLSIVEFCANIEENIPTQSEVRGKIAEAIGLLSCASNQASESDSDYLKSKITDLTKIPMMPHFFLPEILGINREVCEILTRIDLDTIKAVIDQSDTAKLVACLNEYQLPFPRSFWNGLIQYAKSKHQLDAIPILNSCSLIYNGFPE